MKVGIFTDTYLPDINGVVTSVELLRKGLEKEGHEAYVVCAHNSLTSIAIKDHIIYLPGLEIRKFYGYKMASPIHFLFMEEIEKLHFDIIHAETEFGVGIFANIVATAFHIPLVRTYHTTYEDYTHYLNFVNSSAVDVLLKKGVALISKFYCDHCQRLIAPSEKTASMLKRYGVKTEIAIIPTGIERERFLFDETDKKKADEIRDHYIKNKENRLLVFVGRIAKEKSLDMILRVFQKAKDLPLCLLIVGDGPSLKELKDYVSLNGLTSRVFFAGKVPNSEVPYYYHAADGFISASVSETQGLTYLEALSSSLPLIARKDPVLDDLLIQGKTGFFFNNETELLASLYTFSSLSRDDLIKMSENTFSLSGKYDARSFIEKTLTLYEAAILDERFSYRITKTFLKNDCVLMKLCSNDGKEEELLVSLNAYYELGLRNTKTISRFNYNFLKGLEDNVTAYRDCLKKLSYRDHSKKEMRDFLKERKELDESTIDAVLFQLEEKGLIDDKRLVLSRISTSGNALLSKEAMYRKLRKARIDSNIIEECLQSDGNEEFRKAVLKAEQYLRTIHNKSLAATKEAVYAHLRNAGFSKEVTDQAMENLDLSSFVIEENDILKKEAAKIVKRYEKKYSGTILRNKVFMALSAKGFQYDNIYVVINEMEL